MCDLLTVSSSFSYRATYSIPDFAICGQRNCDGWGLGYFEEDGTAVVRKSSNMAYDATEDAIDAELLELSENVRSRYFLGHVRFASCGATCDENCHPFKLCFLGRDWLFAHNGTCRNIMGYETENEQVPDATNDSARIFEYLRDRIVKRYQLSGHNSVHLFRALADATLELMNEYDSDNACDNNFNYLLCDGSMLFVFMHHRPFYVLHRTKIDADALVLTTCSEGFTDGEEWAEMGDSDHSYGTLLLIVDDLVVESAEIARGE